MMMRKKVLLAENDSNGSSGMEKIFLGSGHDVSTATNGISAFEKVVRDHYDIVVTELDLPQMSGIDLLKKIKEVNVSIPVVVVSSNARIQEAVEAMKLGAHDFLLKPLTAEMIHIIISQTDNGEKVTNEGKPEKRCAIITNDREMQRLLKQARDIADSQASVFIQGESGTGKELFARYIHHHSIRRERPFVAINCSALPETLLESELFGHEKGSFTGAFTRKKGRFEIANTGTVLLDEISEMEARLQSKLLRVLQEREIDRVGGTAPIPVDVRIIATTNRDIEKQIRDGQFREDLYYRLNVVPFHLPPLRERKDDIPLLASYLIRKYNRMDRRDVKGLTEDAMHTLMQMPWKGNVRELENTIERTVLLKKEGLIDRPDLFIREGDGLVQDEGRPFIPTFPLKEMERKVILHALDQTNGNRTHAAEMLGITVRTLRNKLNEYRKKMEAQ
jgi:DNA-binding NtrC family response regulator